MNVASIMDQAVREERARVTAELERIFRAMMPQKGKPCSDDFACEDGQVYRCWCRGVHGKHESHDGGSSVAWTRLGKQRIYAERAASKV
jgi:hypothetical protein